MTDNIQLVVAYITSRCFNVCLSHHANQKKHKTQILFDIILNRRELENISTLKSNFLYPTTEGDEKTKEKVP